jgi:ketosteroid isomerase-like protein
MNNLKGGRDEEALRQILSQLELAMTDSAEVRAAFFDRHTDDDYVLTGPTGVVTTKPEILEGLRAGTVKFSSYSMSDLRIRGESGWALIIGVASGEGVNPGGEVFRGDNRFTSVWIKSDDGWKLVAWQATPIQVP